MAMGVDATSLMGGFEFCCTCCCLLNLLSFRLFVVYLSDLDHFSDHSRLLSYVSQLPTEDYDDDEDHQGVELRNVPSLSNDYDSDEHSKPTTTQPKSPPSIVSVGYLFHLSLTPSSHRQSLHCLHPRKCIVSPLLVCPLCSSFMLILII